MKTIVHVVGARPNYVKVAPVRRAFDAWTGFTHVLCDTGQHWDLALTEALRHDLELAAPDESLGVGPGDREAQLARIEAAFAPVVAARRADAIVVVGDVTSTLGCARVGARLGVPVVHVEAGLRSFDDEMPEERNRREADAVATLLLTPSPEADRNLAAEGIDPARIRRVGNVMIDSLRRHLTRARASDALERAGVAPRRYVLLTLHRPENVDRPSVLAGVLDAVAEIQRHLPVLFPVHPRTRAALASAALEGRIDALPRLRVMPPLGYLAFLALEAGAAAVITDSGGVQEETTVLGVPCITLRARTERPITVSHGTNVVTGADPDRIVTAWRAAVEQGHRAPPAIEGWDGHAAERSAAAIVSLLRTGRAG